MKTYTIGRDPTNQITLNDNFVSRQHAQLIITDDGKIILKDLDSTNGSFVNGNKIKECIIKPGDIVKIGGAFLNWSKYLPDKTMIVPPTEFNQMVPEQFESKKEQSIPIVSSTSFSLGKTLKWITIKVLDTGELFKTDWNKTTSILFFLLFPVGLTSLFLLYEFVEIQDKLNFDSNFGYMVILPFLTTFFMYGISQFLTIGLLSIARKVSFNKVLFSSSVLSFLQAIPFLGILLFILVGWSTNHNLFGSLHGGPGYIIVLIFIITFTILLLMTILIYLYQYFLAIGFSKSISVHMVVFSLAINFLLQVTYVFLLGLVVNQRVFFPAFNYF
jgi:hypothetical protein